LSDGVDIKIESSMEYLPLAVVSTVFRECGLNAALAGMHRGRSAKAPFEQVVEALVIQRCVCPDSKLGFQRWRADTALAEVTETRSESLHNSRVHRVLDELTKVQGKLEDWTWTHGVKGGIQALYLDLTDTWFEHGGGSLARKGETKEGHRYKRKIHIELVVDQRGMPLSWRLLPGVLNETTVLPGAIDRLGDRPGAEDAVLIFDRGMVSAKNLAQLNEEEPRRLFLTTVKSDAIPTYIKVDEDGMDRLQSLGEGARAGEIEAVCRSLNMSHVSQNTWGVDLGIVEVPAPRDKRASSPGHLRAYMYFNRDIQLTRRQGRSERLERAYAELSLLNEELGNARQPRKLAAVERKVGRILDRYSLNEVIEVRIEPHAVQRARKAIASFRVTMTQNAKRLAEMARFDGVTLAVGHPQLSYDLPTAIEAYRHKDVVEAGFKTIKSVLEIRPVYHRKDEKIAAHVTLCVMGLLVERLIEQRLHDAVKAGRKCSTFKTAQALLQGLSHVRLNRVQLGAASILLRTQERPEAREILSVLGMEKLLKAYPPGIAPEAKRRTSRKTPRTAL